MTKATQTITVVAKGTCKQISFARRTDSEMTFTAQSLTSTQQPKTLHRPSKRSLLASRLNHPRCASTRGRSVQPASWSKRLTMLAWCLRNRKGPRISNDSCQYKVPLFTRRSLILKRDKTIRKPINSLNYRSEKRTFFPKCDNFY